MPSKRQAVRCHAHSNRSGGQQCKAWAINGGTVCRTHGGSLPWVKEAAQKRLLELVIPAISTVRETMLRGDSYAVRLKAAESILDRTGVVVVQQVELDNQVTITVAFEDVGVVPLPRSERATERSNGHALNGR